MSCRLVIRPVGANLQAKFRGLPCACGDFVDIGSSIGRCPQRGPGSDHQVVVDWAAQARSSTNTWADPARPAGNPNLQVRGRFGRARPGECRRHFVEVGPRLAVIVPNSPDSCPGLVGLPADLADPDPALAEIGPTLVEVASTRRLRLDIPANLAEIAQVWSTCSQAGSRHQQTCAKLRVKLVRLRAL